jgi:hypothetical protein
MLFFAGKRVKSAEKGPESAPEAAFLRGKFFSARLQ